MTDALDRLAGPGADLLDRADAVLLTHGLPADHRVVGLLRRLGALPADTFRAISTQHQAPLRAAAVDLRRTAQRYGHQGDLLTAPVDWAGTAGEWFAAYRAALAGHLGGHPGGRLAGQTGGAGDTGDRDLVGQLEATARYLDDAADWVERSRLAMARVLAEVLGSAEAIRLRTVGVDAPPMAEDAVAAATVGARILGVAADVHTAGLALAQRWAGRLDELPYRQAGVPVTGAPDAGETRVII